MGRMIQAIMGRMIQAIGHHAMPTDRHYTTTGRHALYNSFMFMYTYIVLGNASIHVYFIMYFYR